MVWITAMVYTKTLPGPTGIFNSILLHRDYPSHVVPSTCWGFNMKLIIESPGIYSRVHFHKANSICPHFIISELLFPFFQVLTLSWICCLASGLPQSCWPPTAPSAPSPPRNAWLSWPNPEWSPSQYLDHSPSEWTHHPLIPSPHQQCHLSSPCMATP